jgi:16S rRNA (guanine966-N2)-methyltransferase
VRVIAGYLGGRPFSETHGHRTHPMGEKIRGAIFNALGDITGLTVLDAYSGTGALSIEAASRGAKSVIAIDIDKNAARTIKDNIALLNIGDTVKFTKANAVAWSRRHQHDRFDIVLLDPPYDDVAIKDLIQLSLLTSAGGVLVLSLPVAVGFRLGESKFTLLTHKVYGDAELLFYRRFE